MSAVLIVVIVVVVLILLGSLLALPRMRERARLRSSERELGQRRDRVATEHREQAQSRAQQADVADRRARIAEQEAAKERAEAQLHEERAAMHEEGLADHELVNEDERDRFAGTSAVEERDQVVPDREDVPTRETAAQGEEDGADPERSFRAR